MGTDYDKVPAHCRRNLAMIAVQTAIRKITMGRTPGHNELLECLRDFEECYPELDVKEVRSQIGTDFAARPMTEQVQILGELLSAFPRQQVLTQS